MPVGKKDESAHCGTQKPWRLRFWGFFNNVFGTMPAHSLFIYYILTAVRLSNGAFSGDSLKPRASGIHWGGGTDRLAFV